MSDFRYDPELRRAALQEYDSKSMWAGLAAVLLIVGGLIAAAAFLPAEQTAMKSPTETTGSASPIPTQPPR